MKWLVTCIFSCISSGIFETGLFEMPCIFSCIGSGIFETGFFEMPDEYIMVEHAVDRSLTSVRLWRYVIVRVFLLV